MKLKMSDVKFVSFLPVLSHGASNEADFIRKETDSIIHSLQSTFSIGLEKENVFNKVYAIADECSSPGWDGGNAKPVIDVTLLKANTFLKAIPLGTEAPSISVEPDGSLTFEWYRSPRKLLSVSVGRDCFLHYAALIGERKAYGTEPFFGIVPETISDLISQIISA